MRQDLLATDNLHHLTINGHVRRGGALASRHSCVRVCWIAHLHRVRTYNLLSCAFWQLCLACVLPSVRSAYRVVAFGSSPRGKVCCNRPKSRNAGRFTFIPRQHSAQSVLICDKAPTARHEARLAAQQTPNRGPTDASSHRRPRVSFACCAVGWRPNASSSGLDANDLACGRRAVPGWRGWSPVGRRHENSYDGEGYRGEGEGDTRTLVGTH